MNTVKNTSRTAIALILVIALVGTGCVFAGSLNQKSLEKTFEVSIDGVEYVMSETTCAADNSKVVNVVRRDMDGEPISETGVRQLLALMDYDDSHIDYINEDTIKRLSRAQELGIIITYTRINEFTGERENIPEEKAFKAVKECLQFRSESRAKADHTMVFEQIRSNPYLDSYMRIQLFWDIEPDSDTYEMSTVARWLTMPSSRKTDAVGITGTYIALVPNSYSGYYYYTETTTISGVSSSEIKMFNIANKYTPSNGSWFGAAGKVYLPTDSIGDDDVSIDNSDFVAYFQCRMKVSTPSLQLNFNAAADYTHSKTSIAPSVGITIGYNSFGISFSGESITNQDIRQALVMITYYP